MTILLVRHAHAGDRDAWTGDDLDRPISALGRRQAEELAVLLGDRPIDRILASHAARAIQTVEPLGAHLGLPVERTELLWETTPAGQAREWMAGLAKEHEHDVVLCSHGDLIAPLLLDLERRGGAIETRSRWAKGSVWELEFDGDVVVGARYLPPIPPSA